MEAGLESKILHLLAVEEGLYAKRVEFQEARATSSFQAVFEKNEPLVSVNISTFNRVELLMERCLASLFRQSYSNLHIVVVGDGCTDSTEKAVRSLRDSRISFQNLEQNGPYPPPGVNRWRVAGTHALNRALEVCRGDFVTHLDDDDEFSADRIERLVDQALRVRAEFLWHAFLAQNPDGLWRGVGTPELQEGQVTTGSIFYHRYFTRIPWDVRAYRSGEPGDWNRIRKIAFLRPTLSYVDECLMLHYRERNQTLPAVDPSISFLEE